MTVLLAFIRHAWRAYF